MSRKPLKILYLVHDLSDAAVRKRMMMLQEGGAKIQVAGFYRTDHPVPEIEKCPAIPFCRTYNGGFIQRINSTLREILYLRHHKALFSGADIIIARNLEMLAVAVRGRALCQSEKSPIIIYESLDIHRFLLNRGPVGLLLRTLEGWLSKRASALITSSPAFITEYFEKFSQIHLPIRLVENKIYRTESTQGIISVIQPPAPPWRIGWFGALRCAKSLNILSNLAKHNNGQIEIIIRGHPAYDQIPDFDQITQQTPGVTFEGPYKNPEDLQKIYSEIHFTWAVDLFEEGLNSSWLLPNRLYEGSLYHAVPLAQKNVETGHFLNRLGIGVLLENSLEVATQSFFNDLTEKHYHRLKDDVKNIAISNWICEKKECHDFVQWLEELTSNTPAIQEKTA